MKVYHQDLGTIEAVQWTDFAQVLPEWTAPSNPTPITDESGKQLLELKIGPRRISIELGSAIFLHPDRGVDFTDAKSFQRFFKPVVEEQQNAESGQ